jgi:hypothetical protein
MAAMAQLRGEPWSERLIYVAVQPEPSIFDDRVRKPGNAFLSQHPKPTKAEWRSHDYWSRVSEELRTAYDRICAYTCHWIPPAEGWNTCDHFDPKDTSPQSAYEWSNYRLACGRLNGRKGTRKIVDPFKIEDGWFQIQFPSLQVVTGPNAGAMRQDIQDTIDDLGLSEGPAIQSRESWLKEFCRQAKDGTQRNALAALKTRAPFLASELERQRLVRELKIMSVMQYEDKDIYPVELL